jgi:hypothetical protein
MDLGDTNATCLDPVGVRASGDPEGLMAFSSPSLDKTLMEGHTGISNIASLVPDPKYLM